MWKKVRLDGSGKWVDGAQFPTADAAGGLGSDEYLFFVGTVPSDKDQRTALFDEILKRNGGRVQRIMVGVTVTPSGDVHAMCNCPGVCFCVYAGGPCYCEAYYCEGGLCQIVRCPGFC